MRILIVYNARYVRTPDGLLFSEGYFPYRRWERYLKHFDLLTVICRMSDCSKAPVNRNLSSGPQVSFLGVPDDHDNLWMQLQDKPKIQIIREAIDSCDGLIVSQSHLGWLATREAELRGKPWAVEVIGDAWNAYWNYGKFAGKLYAPIAWWEARRWIRRAKFAIYVTQRYLQEKYPCQGFSCGVSDVEIEPVPRFVLEQKITGRQDKSFLQSVRVGLIGSLVSRYKGLHVALRALRRLRGQGMLLHLHVLGDGKFDFWNDEAKQLGVSDLLHLDGSLPSGEPVRQWLDQLDIYIQPSFQEGLPRALIEAMSRGLPSLGSTCGGIPELLSSECLHHPGDDRTLALQLAKMVREKDWRIQQAEKNFKTAQNYYQDVIEAKRDAFWSRFAEEVRKKTQSKKQEVITSSKKKPAVKVLFLTRHERLSASSRLRCLQYLPWFEQAGFECTVAPLINDAQLQIRYQNGSYELFGLLQSYWRRICVMMKHNRFDMAWIAKEALPWLPAWFEKVMLGGLPYVLDFDDSPFPDRDRYSSNWIEKIFGHRTNYLITGAALVMVGNEYLAKQVRDAGVRKVEILPTVVDLERYPVKIFTSRPNPLRLVWIGSPTTERYLTLLKDSLAQLHQQFDFTLRLIGRKAIDLPGVNVEFVPWAETTESESIQACDIGVMPLFDSPWERGKCGYKLIQYMASALPVVASPVGVNKELVRVGENGFWAGTTDEWIETLAKLMTDASMRQRMGHIGRRYVEAQYCLQKTAPQFIDLLHRVSENPK